MGEKFKNIKYLFITLFKEDKKLFFLVLAQVVVLSAKKGILVLFPKYILDVLLEGKNFNFALEIILGFVILDFALSILDIAISGYQKAHSKRLEFSLHTNVTNKTFNMPYEKLLDSNTYDRMYLASDIANGDNFMRLIDEVKNLFSNFILIAGMIVIIVQLDPLLIIITLAVVTVNVVTDSKIQKQLFKTRKDISNSIRRLEYVGKIAWHIDFAKEARLYDIKDFIHDKYSKLNENVLQKIFNDYRIENKGSYANILAASLQLGIVYLLLGRRLFLSIITVGEFTLYLNAINQFRDSLAGMLRDIVSIEMHSRYFSAYMDYMLEPDNERDNIVIPKSSNIPNDGFYFDCVSYRYPGQSTDAISNLTVHIKSGEKISLVGENGAGKSTFVLLIMKFVKPTKGCIYYNGKNIKEIPDKEYWKLFSTVFQDYNIYNFTVAENITLSRNQDDEHKIIDIIGRCGLKDEILGLDNGINSEVGHDYARNGIDFSGGQRQRLAIARALFKNGDIIILDEPTAALDAKAENEIYTQMKQMANDKTAFFISHRLYSSKICDRILLFENGNIVENGTHSELMNLKSKYYEMFELQAQYYEEEMDNAG